MTKLMEWLCFTSLFISFWLPLLLGLTPISINESQRLHIWLIPIYLVIIFGLISAIIVLYRVMTFNDCPNAYDELKKQIIEAKEDLNRKGFKFNDSKNIN